MPKFLDPTGRTTFGLALCARCGMKFFQDELRPDPNSPGLYVCDADVDQYDPYRLAARPSENVALRFTRPDESLAPDYEGAISDDGLVYIVTDDGENWIVP